MLFRSGGKRRMRGGSLAQEPWDQRSPLTVGRKSVVFILQPVFLLYKCVKKVLFWGKGVVTFYNYYYNSAV